VASLGVDRVVLLNAARVEKSYFDSKVLDPAFVNELFEQGLEQARDTRAPELLVRERFRPFVEDELDALFPSGARLLAHPVAERRRAPRGERTLLAVGPEGGWVPFELELLAARGFQMFSIGPRTLRTEVAVPYLLSALEDWT
jgi:RsmE family RNA methyltransferase